MNHETILMRDLCDTLMQNHAPAADAKIEDAIVQLNITVRQSRQSGVARGTCPD